MVLGKVFIFFLSLFCRFDKIGGVVFISRDGKVRVFVCKSFWCVFNDGSFVIFDFKYFF